MLVIDYYKSVHINALLFVCLFVRSDVNLLKRAFCLDDDDDDVFSCLVMGSSCATSKSSHFITKTPKVSLSIYREINTAT